MWSFLTDALDVLKTAVASWLSYLAGKKEGRVERAENVTKQAEKAKSIQDGIDRLSDDARKRMRERWNR